jgi:pimeloyl-ACP methyl ester carboxylesterase
MDGVGHYLMLERPAEFNKLLREALKELMAK